MRTVQAVTRSRALIVLATLALALTACDSTVHGNPTTTTPTSGLSSSSPSSNDPFAAVSPCTILDQALGGEGYPAAAPDLADPKHSCSVDKPSYGTVALSLQAGQTYEQNIPDPSKAHTGDVNGRPAVQIPERLGDKGACDIAMEVKPGSRATVVIVLLSRNTTEAC